MIRTITILTLGVLMSACSSKLTYNQAVQENQESFTGSDKQSDAQFLVEAKSFSLLEQRLGELAAEKGYAAHVQAFGTTIAEDHRKMNEEIDELADEYDIKVPVEMSPGHMQKYLALKNAQKEAFDDSFAKEIEDVYESHINFFESFATSATNDDIRSFAAKYLGLLRNNETKADKLQNDLL